MRALLLLVACSLASCTEAGAAVVGDSCGPGKVCRPAVIQSPCVATASLPSCGPLSLADGGSAATGRTGQLRCDSTRNCYAYCDGTAWSCVATAATDTCTGTACNIGYTGIYSDGGITSAGLLRGASCYVDTGLTIASPGMIYFAANSTANNGVFRHAANAAQVGESTTSALYQFTTVGLAGNDGGLDAGDWYVSINDYGDLNSLWRLTYAGDTVARRSNASGPAGISTDGGVKVINSSLVVGSGTAYSTGNATVDATTFNAPTRGTTGLASFSFVNDGNTGIWGTSGAGHTALLCSGVSAFDCGGGACQVASTVALLAASSYNRGLVVMDGGTPTVTVVAGQQCVCVNQTGSTVPRCPVVGTTMTLTCAGSDSVSYLCL